MNYEKGRLLRDKMWANNICHRSYKKAYLLEIIPI